MNIKEIALRIAEKDERIAELETYLKSETKDKESAQESFGTIWSKWQRCEKRIAQLEKQRDELLKALDVALENLRPHGDNCFVSDHYEGDPGAGCNCGIDGVTDYLISTIASVKENSDEREQAHAGTVAHR